MRMHHPTLPTIALLAAAAAALLAGCAAPTPQGYGVGAEQSTAAQAQQQMEKAEQATQTDPQQTYLGLIRKMQQANQWYASLAQTEAFERQYGSNTQIRLLRADALRNTGQGTQAEPSYQALLADPDRTTVARARRGLGLLYASQGQYQRATNQLELARQINPIDADVLSDLAYAQMLDGQLGAAKLPILQAAQLAPANARVQLNLALYWLASGEQAQAAQLLQRLRQPPAKNQPPLADSRAIDSLQQQLAIVQQAMQARSGAVPAMPVPVPTPLPALAVAPAAAEPVAPPALAAAPAAPTTPAAPAIPANAAAPVTATAPTTIATDGPAAAVADAPSGPTQP